MDDQGPNPSGAAGKLVQSFREIETRRELRRAVVAYYRSEGIARASYHGHYSDGLPRVPVADGFPEEWVRPYVEDHLDLVDPIPKLASQRVQPFRWSEAQHVADLSPAMLEYLLEMRLAGLGDGLAMMVFGPNLRNAYVSLGFEHADFDPSPEKVMEFQWVAQAGHLRFCAISDRAEARDRALSNREMEVLELVALGKSNAIIAELLGISAHTVDTHLRRIFAKLDVADRTSAVLAGVRTGVLLHPVRR